MMEGFINMDIRVAVANRIIELCKEKDISLYRLTQLSGVPHSTLMSILNGTSRNPGIITIYKICCALDITLSEFYNTHLFNDYN